VPGQPQQSQPQYGTVQPKQQPLQHQQQQQYVDNTPGYGSLRGKAQPQVVSGYYYYWLNITTN